jgi:glycosyltransferase involved in cell wall biosynthesis
MKIAIATDAWFPQVNGVVRTIAATVRELEKRGHQVELVTPDQFTTLPLPFYSSIRLAIAPRPGIRRILDRFEPDIVHISTEGPIGWSARSWCRAHNAPFTTAFHTRFPDYVALRTGISADRFWPIMRQFHAPSAAVLVATAGLADELAGRGMTRTRRWSRGIDHAIFHASGSAHPTLANLPRPIMLNVGRVAVEKNLEAFLDIEMPGSKVIAGDGPDLARLREKYPSAFFLGSLSGDALAAVYRGADCFVFPSRTDTFGLVIIEALASGLPVAAYPVAGPIDIIGVNGRGADDELPTSIGALDDDLAKAIRTAIGCDRETAIAYGRSYSWERATDEFLEAIECALATTDDGSAPATKQFACH